MGALLTAIQMRVGFSMIHLGPKRTIVFLVYSLVASLLGSCFLYWALSLNSHNEGIVSALTDHAVALHCVTLMFVTLHLVTQRVIWHAHQNPD